MKGPFSLYEQAKDQAEPGEVIMARNERYYPEQGWCVMTNEEAQREYNNPQFREWGQWEAIK